VEASAPSSAEPDAATPAQGAKDAASADGPLPVVDAPVERAADLPSGCSAQACPPVTHGRPVCAANNSCGVLCDPDAQRCVGAAACERHRWDFENGAEATVGWTALDRVAGNVDSSTRRAHGGVAALAVPYTSGQFGHIIVYKKLCGMGSLQFRGTLHFWIYREEPAGSLELPVDCESEGVAGGLRAGSWTGTLLPARWTMVTVPLTTDVGFPLDELTIRCRVDGLQEGKTGMLYVDDIVLE
jgi:hypothetical protein